MSGLSLPATGSTPDEVLAWGTAVEPAPRWAGSPTWSAGPGAVRLRSMAAAWERRGEASLQTSTAGMLRGLGAVGASMLLVASRRDATFRYDVQMAGMDAAASLGAAFQEVEAHPADLVLVGAHRLALVGPPRGSARPDGLLDLLLASRLDGWALVVRATPADPRALTAQGDHLHSLHDALLERQRRDEARTPQARVTAHDSAATEAAELVAHELDRNRRARRAGAWEVEAWLTADLDETVVSLAAAAGHLCDRNGAGRPFRATPEGAAAGGPTVAVHEELATLVQPPRRDTTGLTIRSFHPIRRDPPPHAGGASFRLGANDDGAAIAYELDRLCAHATVTGATGSGKSSFVRALLTALPTPFLVIEPTKSEYSGLADEVWSIGEPGRGPLRLNPLEAPDVPPTVHIDLLCGLLTDTLELPTPLPQLLGRALHHVYEARGWDLRTGSNPWRDRDPDHPVWPTLSELRAECLDQIDRQGYGPEVRDNLRGAVRARLGSLCEGPKADVFDTDRPGDLHRLLRRRAVVELDALADPREKAFVVGLLAVRLWEARRHQPSSTLRHVTVIEEAHRLFRSPPPHEGVPASTSSFTVDTLGDLLSEARASGEGFVLVDQSVRRLLPEAVANAALKVGFRAPHPDDHELLGAAMGLPELDRRALAVLPDGAALIHREGMGGPVRARAASVWSTPPPVAHVAAAPSVPRRAIRAHALRYLVTPPEHRAAAAQRLHDAVATLLPPGASVGDAAGRAVGLELEHLGRSRRWSVARRQEAAMALRAGDLDADPSQLVLDGTQPHPFCASVCPAGGCPARELVAALLEEGPAPVPPPSAGGGSPVDRTISNCLAAHLAHRAPAGRG